MSYCSSLFRQQPGNQVRPPILQMEVSRDSLSGFVFFILPALKSDFRRSRASLRPRKQWIPMRHSRINTIVSRRRFRFSSRAMTTNRSRSSSIERETSSYHTVSLSLWFLAVRICFPDSEFPAPFDGHLPAAEKSFKAPRATTEDNKSGKRTKEFVRQISGRYKDDEVGFFSNFSKGTIRGFLNAIFI